MVTWGDESAGGDSSKVQASSEGCQEGLRFGMTMLYRGNIGLAWGYIGILENEMETTIEGLRVASLGFWGFGSFRVSS